MIKWIYLANELVASGEHCVAVFAPGLVDLVHLAVIVSVSDVDRLRVMVVVELVDLDRVVKELFNYLK